jgi:hypothetical protein
MLTRPIELDVVTPGADRDAAVLGVYNAGAAIAVAAGAFGFYMAAAEDISPRQRLIGMTGALGTGAFGVATLVKPVDVAAMLRLRLPPWALPLVGLLGIAGSGYDHSPMFFPGVILTAFGGGRLGPARIRKRERTASLTLGATAAGGYLAVVIGAGRPWRDGWKRSLLWNIGVAPIFFVACPLGGELGDLALATRRLERTRARDRAALRAAGLGGRGGLRNVARKIGRTAADLEKTLLRIASRHRSLDDAHTLEVERALDEVRGHIQHHLLGPILVAAANNEPLDLVVTLNAILDVYRDGWREEKISVVLDSRVPEGLTIDARVTSVLVRATKVALDNCHKHQRKPLREITVRLGLSADRIVLGIRDDGGATSSATPESWGIGLSETLAHVRSVEGTMTLEPAADGLELTIVLPRRVMDIDALELQLPMAGRIDDALAHCAPLIRPATWFGGVMCLLTARDKRVGVTNALAFSALVGADRLWYRLAPEDRRRALLTLAVSLLWPAGGRPATGWTGLELVALGARGHTAEVRWLGPLVFATTALSARRVRHTLEPGRFRENVAFPLACAASGLAAGLGRASLVRVERETLGLRERAELIEQLAGSVRLRHDLIKPLRSSDAWYDAGIMESEEGQTLLALSGEIDALTRDLLALIAVADPIRDIQRHLQLRLDPARVTVAGECPVSAPERAEETAVRRAREHLAVVALADELADRILARFPPRLTGRSRLCALHIDIRPLDEREMRVCVLPSPPDARPDYDLGAFVSALRRLPGRLIDGFDGGGLTFTVPRTALVAR